MKILILEGIPTSGKTTVCNKIQELLQKYGKTFLAVDEEETMWKLGNNTDKKVSIKFLKEILEKAMSKPHDVVIFDRLHFSQVFRTNGSVVDFKEIEDLISDKAFIAFFKISEESIPTRITNAMEHRPKEWTIHVKKKESMEEIIHYYTTQQKLLEGLLLETTLRNETYSTDTMNFENIAEKIFKKMVYE
ncbi:MAG: hypothetical protein ACK4NC_02925 [Candidatus Gracilibacteria bacterium]